MATTSLLVREDDIDNDILIQQVKMRPPLYNKKLKEYSDSNLKIKMWEEVAMKVFVKTWRSLSKGQQSQAGKLIRKRWKNIRACFTRELKKQQYSNSEGTSKKRRRYLYYDELLFLLPNMQMRERDGNIRVLESDKEDTEEEVQIEQTPTPPRRRCNKKNSIEQRLLKLLQKKKTGTGYKGQDTHFALSLVPMLKALPQNEKLDVQIQILQIFKNVTESQPTSDNQTLSLQHQASSEPGPSGIQLQKTTPQSFPSKGIPYFHYNSYYARSSQSPPRHVDSTRSASPVLYIPPLPRFPSESSNLSDEVDDKCAFQDP